jgi:2'-5' RNA ligase
MRLFVGLDLHEDVRRRISSFQDGVREFALEARWARPESMHVTIKFIGERPEEDLGRIRRTLEGISAEPFEVKFRGCGFFPSARAPRVFWIGVEAGSSLASLADSVDTRLEAVGILREEHEYTPHLTLARSSSGSGSPGLQPYERPHERFQRLQEKLKILPTPEFGATTAREFFLYCSQLSASGSKYTKLAAYALR